MLLVILGGLVFFARRPLPGQRFRFVSWREGDRADIKPTYSRSGDETASLCGEVAFAT